MKTYFYNAEVVGYDEVAHNCSVLLEDDLIRSVNPETPTHDRSIDCEGHFILPGIVDLHCDVIEHDVEMRPNVHFPMDLAVSIADRRCASAGIITQFHGVSFGHQKRGLHDTTLAEQLVRTIRS